MYAIGQWVGPQPKAEVQLPLQLRSPELVIGSDYGAGVDVWALGCLAFELLVGEQLFNPVACGDDWTVEEDLIAQVLAITGRRFSSATLDRTQWKNRLLDGEGKGLFLIH